jgi:glycosyltransferase involved in cell wall biosynthesis
MNRSVAIGAQEAHEELETARAADDAALRIAFVGASPDWLHTDEALEALEPFEPVDLTHAASGPPDVVHLSATDLSALSYLRRAYPESALVVDLTSIDALTLGRRDRRRLDDATHVVVGSLSELREIRRLHPSLARRSSLLRPPVDLNRFAPEAALAETRGRDLRRHRREYRLVGRAVLFAGPYTDAGGLAVLVEAMYALRESAFPELRLCAVPLGDVDRRYLDRVERRALKLGHHAPIRWSLDEAELPLWFACADVVCDPSRVDNGATAVMLAAAAGAAFVGTDSECAHEHVVDGVTGRLVPRDDVDALAAAIADVLADEELLSRMRADARLQAEQELSIPVAAVRLRRLWLDAFELRG